MDTPDTPNPTTNRFSIWQSPETPAGLNLNTGASTPANPIAELNANIPVPQQRNKMSKKEKAQFNHLNPHNTTGDSALKVVKPTEETSDVSMQSPASGGEAFTPVASPSVSTPAHNPCFQSPAAATAAKTPESAAAPIPAPQIVAAPVPASPTSEPNTPHTNVEPIVSGGHMPRQRSSCCVTM